MSDFVDLVGCIVRANGGQLGIRDLLATAYLCDWKHALVYGDQMTEMPWQSKSIESESGDIITKLFYDKRFTFIRDKKDVMIVKLLDNILDDCEKGGINSKVDLINSVVQIYNSFASLDKSRLVHSTYPFMYEGGADHWNLSALAARYKEISFRRDKVII